MRRVGWAPAALADLEAIERHWIDERPDYVARTFRSIDEAVRLLREMPALGAPFGDGGRRKRKLGHTPYLLIYRYDATTLRVLRIRHHSQDWQRGP